MDRLDAGRDLIHVEEPFSTEYEVAAALKRFDAGKALVFERVKGYETKIVGGICGTRARILDGLGVEPENLYGRLQEAVKNPEPCEVGDGPVKEVVLDDASLGDFPVLTHFEGDPGPYITSGILYARSPDGSVENVSFHRLLVLDGKRMGIRVVPRHLYRIKQIAQEAGVSSLDVSIPPSWWRPPPLRLSESASSRLPTPSGEAGSS
jgi:UbiD family decarboxylase